MSVTVAGKSSGQWQATSYTQGITSGAKFRLASEEDASKIADINIRAWQHAYKGLLPDALLNALSIDGATEGWRQKLRDKQARVWLVEDDGLTRGFASIGVSFDQDASASTGELFTIYLEPSYLNKGIGKALLQTAIDDLRKSNFRECTVWFLADNDRARRFYEKAGFQNDNNETTIELNGNPIRETRYRLSLK